jgi:hypothetical protein
MVLAETATVLDISAIPICGCLLTITASLSYYDVLLFLRSYYYYSCYHREGLLYTWYNVSYLYSIPVTVLLPSYAKFRNDMIVMVA